MALLLAMYQKMRLIREKNQLVLEQTRTSSQLSRIEKNIERRQKYFTGLLAQIDSQAKMLTSNASIWFQNQCGLGYGSVNPMNYTGINGFVMNGMAQILQQGIKHYGNDGKPTGDVTTISQDRLSTMFTLYNQGGGKINPCVDDDGKIIYTDADEKIPQYPEGITAEEVKAFNYAMQQAQMQQQQAQMWVQNANQQYTQNVSIWAEAEKARIEAMQDAEIEPLNYKQTMLELEKEQKDMRLKRLEAELESYKELASKEAENSAPTFGLR